MLLVGLWVCINFQLMDVNGFLMLVVLIFYKRVKVLYDVNYEDDWVIIVQFFLLMGWYWEGFEDVIKNVFYWICVVIIVVQGLGMYWSVEGLQFSRFDKRLWKCIWWILFIRDWLVVVVFGWFCYINFDDLDVEMLIEDDFIEDDIDYFIGEYLLDFIYVQFFLQYVKFCEIMGLVLLQQYLVVVKGRWQNVIDFIYSDMVFVDWFQNCFKIVYWEMLRYYFWFVLFYFNYYIIFCLFYCVYMFLSGFYRFLEDLVYLLCNIVFQVVVMIILIIENFIVYGEFCYCLVYVVYSLFLVFIMYVYQFRLLVQFI